MPAPPQASASNGLESGGHHKPLGRPRPRLGGRDVVGRCARLHVDVAPSQPRRVELGRDRRNVQWIVHPLIALRSG